MIVKIVMHGPEGPRDTFVSGLKPFLDKAIAASGWDHRLDVSEVDQPVPGNMIDYILPLSNDRLVRDLRTSKLIYLAGGV